MWPGFGENCRVLEWIFNRTDLAHDDHSLAVESPIGLLPAEGAIKLAGLKDAVDMSGLFDLPRDFWLQEVTAIRKYFDEQVNVDLPPQIADELDKLDQRVRQL